MTQWDTTQELDYQVLDKELDKTKTKVFLGKNAAFLGPLMCSMTFFWEPVKTACTNGISLKWDPHHFLLIPAAARITTLVHELWHPALLHMLRRGDRNPLIWNYACDISINNMLDLQGYSFEGMFPEALGFPPGTKPWLDHSYGTQPAEEIYDALMKKNENELNALMELLKLFPPDLEEPGEGEDPIDPHTIINNVVAATHSAGLGGAGAGDLPGEVTITLKRFLQPKLPWAQLFFSFFNELAEEDYTWLLRDRRYQDVYLPSLQEEDEGGLDHIMAFEDVSGSVTDGELVRFNSEFKYIKEAFNPKKLTLIQFDTIIQKVTVFNEEDAFDELVVTGRGGTSLVCVRDYILEHRPTVVVVFSDLHCPVMEKLPSEVNIPIIWVAINNHAAKVNEGRLIHIRE